MSPFLMRGRINKSLVVPSVVIGGMNGTEEEERRQEDKLLNPHTSPATNQILVKTR